MLKVSRDDFEKSLKKDKRYKIFSKIAGILPLCIIPISFFIHIYSYIYINIILWVILAIFLAISIHKLGRAGAFKRLLFQIRCGDYIGRYLNDICSDADLADTSNQIRNSKNMFDKAYCMTNLAYIFIFCSDKESAYRVICDLENIFAENKFDTSRFVFLKLDYHITYGNDQSYLKVLEETSEQLEKFKFRSLSHMCSYANIAANERRCRGDLKEALEYFLLEKEYYYKALNVMSMNSALPNSILHEAALIDLDIALTYLDLNDCERCKSAVKAADSLITKISCPISGLYTSRHKLILDRLRELGN